MNEHDLKLLREYMDKAHKAGIHGDYLREKELMEEAGKLIYGYAWLGGLFIKNTDTGDVEEIEIL